MNFYNPTTGQVFSLSQLALMYGQAPSEDKLRGMGLFPLSDPMVDNANLLSLLTKSGYARTDEGFSIVYSLSPQVLTSLQYLLEHPAVPVGQISFFSRDFPPAGYLVCDGSTYQISDYPVLGYFLGDLYGGDGITTFTVPDLRGQFIRGWDDGAGVDPGRVFGSNQDDAFEAHSHVISDTLGPAGSLYAAGTSGKSVNYTAGSPTTSVGGAETRPKNVALLPCIFSGVFETPTTYYYGTINTGRGDGLGPEDLNPSYFTSFNTSGSLTESETELYIPGTDTVIPYDSGLPAPFVFDSLGDCFTPGDYTVQIRITATSQVIGEFTCPDSPTNVDVSWGTAP